MSEKQQPKRCFVIMPFSKTTAKHTQEYWTKHFDDFLKPLIEESLQIEAFRSEALRVDIVKQIIADLITSDVVVADLTDHNPNVYWELGIRQSFKYGTITIAEESTKLASDIEKKGTLFYKNERLATVEFSKQLKKLLKIVLIIQINAIALYENLPLAQEQYLECSSATKHYAGWKQYYLSVIQIASYLVNISNIVKATHNLDQAVKQQGSHLVPAY